MEQINIQKEVSKILHQFGNTEMGLYKIQLLCEEYVRAELMKLKNLKRYDPVGCAGFDTEVEESEDGTMVKFEDILSIIEK